MTMPKVALFAALGAFFWFIAAIWLREFAPAFYDLGVGHIAAFTLSAAAAPLFIWIMAKIGRTPLNAMLAPSCMALTVATLLDGIAITYFPAFYAGPGPQLAYTGAQLLWGVGFVMLTALILERR